MGRELAQRLRQLTLQRHHLQPLLLLQLIQPFMQHHDFQLRLEVDFVIMRTTAAIPLGLQGLSPVEYRLRSTACSATSQPSNFLGSVQSPGDSLRSFEANSGIPES